MTKESQNIEWKQSRNDDYLKWIWGFANAQGGRISVKDTIKSPGKGPINSPDKNVNLPPKNREEVRIKCWGCICIML